ncbi:hypothetical protein FRB96_009540 [Tulasnella sp. 330]|nr:hypothetical protein FRB96_009540 [Tulasnella sp. 330]KAG8880137.1 hypothetical protein FRB97_001068 [Tulasnella sp. 331]
MDQAIEPAETVSSDVASIIPAEDHSLGIIKAISYLKRSVSEYVLVQRSIATLLTSIRTWETLDPEDAYALFVAADYDSDVQDVLTPRKPHEPVTIAQLPVELLIKIFEDLYPPEIWSVSHLQMLASVTKQFHLVVTSTPTLWAVAKYCGPSSSDMAQVTLALKKSKQAPLSIICNVDGRVPNSDIRPFVQAVVDQAHRWRSATFSTRSAVFISLYINDLPMPLLERFSYANWTTSPTAIRVGGVGARLRDLTLIGAIPVMKQLDTLAHLEVLCLDSIALPGDTLRNILVSCSGLQILFLNRLKDGRSTIPPAPSPAPDPIPIRLDRLRILSLTNVSLGTMKVATSIEADSLTKLRFKSLQEITSREFLTLLAQPRSGLQSLFTTSLRLLTKLGITVNDAEEVGITSSDKKPGKEGELLAGGGNVAGQSAGLSLLLTSIRLDEVWDRVKEHIPADIPITLDVSHRWSSVPFKPAILHSMRSLECLQMSFNLSSSGGKAILDYLSKPSLYRCHAKTTDCFDHDRHQQQLDGGDSKCLSWPCPKLVDLRMSAHTYGADDSNLVEFFVKRYGPYVPEEREDQTSITKETSVGEMAASYPRPASLTAVRVFKRRAPPSADTVSRISDVLGKTLGSEPKTPANLHFS